MDDLISRQAAIDAWKNDFKGYINALNMPKDDYNGIMEYIDEVPSAQLERKKGKWSFIGDNMFECTCCGTPYTTQQLNGLRNYNTDPYAPNFCPNCGADMRGE